MLRKIFLVAGCITFMTAFLSSSAGALRTGGSPRSPQTAASAKSDAHAEEGHQIFTQNCMQCHAILEGQYSFGPNLHGELAKPHPKKTPAEVREILKNGKGKMPAFKDKLTDENMDNLVAYLRTV